MGEAGKLRECGRQMPCATGLYITDSIISSFFLSIPACGGGAGGDLHLLLVGLLLLVAVKFLLVSDIRPLQVESG